MSPPLVRLVAAPPWTDDLVVVGEFERRVHVLSIEESAYVTSLNTFFDFGGRRVSVSVAGCPVVVAGSWELHGVCGYGLDGSLLWQNRSRTNVQTVTPLSGGVVAVSYESQPTIVLDAATGEEVRSLRAVKQVFTLAEDLSLFASTGYARLANGEQQPVGKRIRLESFAVLDAASDGELVAVAEAGGPLRLLTVGGTERARFTVRNGHALHVTHDPATKTWIALTDGRRSSLVRLNDRFEVLDEIGLGAVIDACAVLDGRNLIVADMEGLSRITCSDFATQRLPNP